MMAKSRGSRLFLAIALGLFTAVGAWRLNAADDAKPVQGEATETSTEFPAEAEDLTEKVEVTINGGLRSTSRTQHSAAIVIKNISDEDLKGPLVVVVDETGLIALTVAEEDGKLAEGEPYVEVMNQRGTLKAGRSLRAQKIEFETEDLLTLDERQQFDLKVRVLYLPESARVAENGDEHENGNIPGKKYSEQDLARVMAIQERWTPKIAGRNSQSIYGTAVAENADGELVVKVYTERPGIRRELPAKVDGVSVEDHIIGHMFRAVPAYDHTIYENGVPKDPGRDKRLNPGEEPPEPTPGNGQKPGGSPGPGAQLMGAGGDPTQTFPRPVPIGVSIANTARLFDLCDDPLVLCYSGTLGCRCIDPLGTEFFLTNAHVGGAFGPECDIPLMTGFVGESIVQASTGDELPFPCVGNPANIIGFLADIEDVLLTDDPDECWDGTAPINIMDAAIGIANPGQVHYCTPVDGYGAPSRDLAPVKLGMPVQKYGRTTIYTSQATVTGVNAMVCVDYGNDYFGLFIKQIECSNVTPFGNPFSDAGDSGALIVVNDPGGPHDKKPVALNFAGGGGIVDISIANPLSPILLRFNVQIDDGSGLPSNAGVSGTMGGVLGELDPPSEP